MFLSKELNVVEAGVNFDDGERAIEQLNDPSTADETVVLEAEMVVRGSTYL